MKEREQLIFCELQLRVRQLCGTAVVCGHITTLVSVSLLTIFVLRLALRVSSSQSLLSILISTLSSFPHAIPYDWSTKFCSKGPECDDCYLNDRLYFIIKVKQLWIVFLYLSGAINSSFSFAWIKLSFNWPVQEQIRLYFFLVHYWSISESFNKCLCLNCEVLPATYCSRRRHLKTCVKSGLLSYKLTTLSLRLGAYCVCAGCFLCGGGTSFLF